MSDILKSILIEIINILHNFLTPIFKLNEGILTTLYTLNNSKEFAKAQFLRINCRIVLGLC